MYGPGKCYIRPARLLEEVNAFGPLQEGREVLALEQVGAQPLKEECVEHVHARASRLVQTRKQLRATAGKRRRRPAEMLDVKVDERVVEQQVLGARVWHDRPQPAQVREAQRDALLARRRRERKERRIVSHGGVLLDARRLAAA